MQYKDMVQPLREDDFLSPDETVASAVSRLKTRPDRLLVIRKGDEIPGLFSDRVLLNAFEKCVAGTKISEIDPEAYAWAALEKPVSQEDFQSAEVCLVKDERGRLCGFVTKKIAYESMLEHLANKLADMSKDIHVLSGYEYKESENLGSGHSGIFSAGKSLHALLESNKRMWKILRYSATSIYVADSKGDTLFVNMAFERGTSTNLKDVLHINIAELEKQGFFNPAVTPLVLKEKKTITVRQRAGRGTKWSIVTGTPIFDENGDIDMVVTNAKDIAEYEMLQYYIEKGHNRIMESADTMSRKGNPVCAGAYMKNVLELAEKAASVDTTVLITGESGVGKGVISRYIHAKSGRHNGKLIEINCSAIPESLFESEFFGYESGAFTGAKEGGKPGIFEMANGGTLVLDEIGDMPFTLQAKLLNVLQDKKLTRLGGIKEVDIDIRIIASTNQDLETLIAEDKFRADLYYRLNVFPIHIIPLRERTEEIPLLAEFYLRHYNEKYYKGVKLSNRFLSMMRGRPWYGNVRELEYFVERLVIMCDGLVDESDLLKETGKWAGAADPKTESADQAAVTVRRIIPLQTVLEEAEKQLFLLASRSYKTTYEVAAALKTSQPNAFRKLKKYSIK